MIFKDDHKTTLTRLNETVTRTNAQSLTSFHAFWQHNLYKEQAISLYKETQS